MAELLRGRLGNGEGRTEFLGLLNQRGNVVLLGVEKGFRSKEEAVRLSALSALREFAGRLLQEDEKELANRLLLGSLLTEHGSTLMGAMVTAIDITPSASPSVRSNIIETLVSIMSRRVERESGFAAYALDTLGEGQRVPEDMRSALQRSH